MNLTGSVSVPFQSVFQFRSQPLCDTSVKPTENDSPTASAALIRQVSDPAGIWSESVSQATSVWVVPQIPFQISPAEQCKPR